MKTKSFLAMSLMALMAAACSSDEIVAPEGGNQDGGNNYEGQSYIGLSIKLPTTNGTRAADTNGNDDYDMGTAKEYQVNKLTVRYLSTDGTLTELASFSYNADELIWSTPPAAVDITTTAVLPVEKVGFSGNAFALVEINNPTEPETSIKKNEAWTGKNADYITGAGKDDFFMTNTVYKDGHFLVPVTTSTTEFAAQALAATHTIYVERAAAKVQLNVAAKGTANWAGATYTIPAGKAGAGAKVAIKSWVLDITNKKMFPIRKFNGTGTTGTTYPQGYPVADFARFYSTTAGADYRTYWAVDPNYDNKSIDAGDFDVKGTYPATANELNGIEYCLENTFSVKNQCQNQTTRALIQAAYIPAGFKANETWYTLGNSSTPLHAKNVAVLIRTAIGKGGSIALNDDQIPAGTNEFTAAMFTPGAPSYDAATDLPKVQKALGQITKYDKGKCFYVVRIKHFGDIACPWGEDPKVSGVAYDKYAELWDNNSEAFDKAYLGRYGVVRNNWYKITINSISQPGSPIVPTPTTEQDDEHYNYLQSTINILDWAVRNQGVEL